MYASFYYMYFFQLKKSLRILRFAKLKKIHSEWVFRLLRGQHSCQLSCLWIFEFDAILWLTLSQVVVGLLVKFKFLT